MIIDKREFNKIRSAYRLIDISKPETDYNSYYVRTLDKDNCAFIAYSKDCDIGLVLLSKTLDELLERGCGSDLGTLSYQRSTILHLKTPIDYVIGDVNSELSLFIPTSVLNSLYSIADNYRRGLWVI